MPLHNLRVLVVLCSAVVALLSVDPLDAQESSVDLLADRLKSEEMASLVADVESLGDPARGAMVFYRPEVTCTKCHLDSASDSPLGPILAEAGTDRDIAYMVESVLHPSAKIKEGFEAQTVLTIDGNVFTGLVESETDDQLVLRDPTQPGVMIEIPIDDIEERATSEESVMPDGLASVLNSRQEFLDLAAYLTEIAKGGPEIAAALRPATALVSVAPLPEYEKRIDHAGFIRDWNRGSLGRGQEIYERLCINCHGTKEQPGSLPTSLRFASGKFKSGSDPYTMYRTLTHGYGLMIAQSWMVPEQKYDVIHYIREAYLKNDNPTQYFNVTDEYLAGLPDGDTRGPKPVKFEPWVTMDYGPTMMGTFEFGKDASNFAYKGIAVRLDPGPGGVSQGTRWIVYDHDTMRVAGAWKGRGFIDWNGIHFNGKHGIHPRVVGDVVYENKTMPGWGRPSDGTFADPRLRGRDDRLYGPLPRDWAQYRGMYHYGSYAVIDYTVGTTRVLEMPGLDAAGDVELFTRTFNIGPRDVPMTLQVASAVESDWKLASLDEQSVADSHQLFWGNPAAGRSGSGDARSGVQFDGETRIDIVDGSGFDMTHRDFSIVADIKTTAGGTIICQTEADGEWVPDGKTLFVRGGRLCYDIGWVGVVTSHSRINDGQWHRVALTFDADEDLCRLYVDGELEASRELAPKDEAGDQILRIGYTAEDFPNPSGFEGEISRLWLVQRRLSDREISATDFESTKVDDLVADYALESIENDKLADRSDSEWDGTVQRGEIVSDAGGNLLVGVSTDLTGHRWFVDDSGQLRLELPAGREPLKFTLAIAETTVSSDTIDFTEASSLNESAFDLSVLTSGGPPRWNQVIEKPVRIGTTGGPFEVDVLEHPQDNPWRALVRLSGFDFFADADRMAVCSWDGDVWIVTGLSATAVEGNAGPREQLPILKWKRIASGMFQPLGVKIVNGDIYVTCRDQIAILRDLNNDGEVDYYESFNNDHQVTEHFHEFAMGLQTDDEGNFYYAKSARHALTAIVPHHGTLLKVSPDGEKTEILATGFRAANGVCLNPDGTFIVTDQEGHWNPKNRINWVKPGGFYGNMFGYHDVTDSSDEAMEQPLCWITNAFDRSPAELLWVDSDKWGPLQGQLLNLSYGYGQVFVVPYEEINGQVQGGMCALPIPRLPTGIMRGRFHPVDGQLYSCGMFAWAGNQTQPGGFYRVRYTGQPVQLPAKLHARKNELEIRFSGELKREVAEDVRSYRIKTWSLRRTANYGSKHFDERSLDVRSVRLSDDGRAVILEIPDLQPTWCMEIKYTLRSADNKAIEGTIHNTIHTLGD